MKLQFTWSDGQQDLEARRQGDEARILIDGQPHQLTLLERAGPLMTFRYADEQGQLKLLRLALQAQGTARHLWVNGRHYQYERPASGRPSQTGPGADASLAPTIPSIVSQILVQLGQTVAAGEKLILLESMKMVIPIQAPYAGVVASIDCEVGDAVEPGRPLLGLTPADVEN